MSSCSSPSTLLGLHHPFSTSTPTPTPTPTSKRKTFTSLIHSSNGSRGSCSATAFSIFSASLPPSPPLAKPSLTVQPSGNRASGQLTHLPKEEGGDGMGRREAVGLVACLNALLFLRVAAGEEEAGAAPPAPAEGGTCSLTVAPSGLAFCDRLVGGGAAATKGQLIKAHYVGKLESGKVFDSSYSRGKPLTFRIGVGEVIKGWDQGILGGEGIPPMLSGGKRILRIPPELAYGMRGAGCRGGSCIIPPDSTLFFDVEFVGKA